ncbi:hypothetical protein AAMO2058_000833800 [Amorphochlora amoebiformis]
MKKASGLVRRLFDGKIDIIGDVHGEAGALATLLDRLGYDGLGHHPDNRRLVFVGDLVDRGPNSVAVVDIIKNLVKRGKAQMVLGNHEINLLRGRRKHGNHWFYGEPEIIRKDMAAVSYQVLAPNKRWREETLEFFAEQPLVLEGKDVTVVHAAIDSECLSELKKWDKKAAESNEDMGILDAYAFFQKRVVAEIKDLEGKKQPGEDLEIQKELIRQNSHPIKVTSSGREERAEKKYFAGGSWRRLSRAAWWNSYEGSSLIVVGHYWRRFTPPNPKLVDGFNPSGKNPFGDNGDYNIAGGGGGVLCVDYSVGIRYEERAKGWSPGAMGTGLAALRFPEMMLMFDDGRERKVGKAAKVVS